MSEALLDLYCGAGGASMGYDRAGFERIVGVDNRPQPHYPFELVVADALDVLHVLAQLPAGLGHPGAFGFVAVHASPPCERYSRAQRIRGREHPDLVGPTRELLDASGLPYVIENVEGAPLRDPQVLEGQMFDGLRTVRARYFEANWPLAVPLLRLAPPPVSTMGRRPVEGEYMHVVGNFNDAEAGRAAMGISWMTRDELSEAVPPAYTEFVGEQLLAHVRSTRAAA